MPLKRAVLPLVAEHSPLVDLLGLANTVRLGEQPRLANTDVGGIEAVLRGRDRDGRRASCSAGEPRPRARSAALGDSASGRVVAARRP